jgi:hypothetical protein
MSDLKLDQLKIEEEQQQLIIEEEIPKDAKKNNDEESQTKISCSDFTLFLCCILCCLFIVVSVSVMIIVNYRYFGRVIKDFILNYLLKINS